MSEPRVPQPSADQPGWFELDGLSFTLVCDGIVHVDSGGPFGLVPRMLYETYFRPDHANRVPQSLTCMLVRSEGKTLLVDTGLGPKLTAKQLKRWSMDRSAGGLRDSLGRAGVQPEDVDIVLDTHLHWDHAGGNTEMQADTAVAQFPNATYMVQWVEWAEASKPDARTAGTYFAENFEPLVEAGQMQLLHEDTAVTKHVMCVRTPGHTLGHQSVLLRAADWRGLFVADLASYAVHMARTAWLTAYDVLPLENIRTKVKWQKWALARSAWLFFQHDPYLPVGRLMQTDGDRLQVASVEAAEPLTTALPTPQPPVE